MTGVRQAKAEETRTRLLSAARTLFTEQGYFSTGTEEIVAVAEVGTRGALYHHFADKKGLFEAVFEQVELDLAARAAVVITGDTGLARLTQGLDAFLDASLEPDVSRIILIDGPAVLGWARWREIEAQHGLGAIRHMLDDGVADGSIDVSDSQALAHLLLSAVDEAALFIAHAKQPKKARTQAGNALRSLLAGLAANHDH
jgi:AcrR family transcriptional regulator